MLSFVIFDEGGQDQWLYNIPFIIIMPSCIIVTFILTDFNVNIYRNWFHSVTHTGLYY